MSEKGEMDNPCKRCDKANIHYDFEYGCDEPCQKAEDFFESVGDKLDEILKKLCELIEKAEGMQIFRYMKMIYSSPGKRLRRN